VQLVALHLSLTILLQSGTNEEQVLAAAGTAELIIAPAMTITIPNTYFIATPSCRPRIAPLGANRAVQTKFKVTCRAAKE
jgi:hypothetical protein